MFTGTGASRRRSWSRSRETSAISPLGVSATKVRQRKAKTRKAAATLSPPSLPPSRPPSSSVRVCVSRCSRRNHTARSQLIGRSGHFRGAFARVCSKNERVPHATLLSRAGFAPGSADKVGEKRVSVDIERHWPVVVGWLHRARRVHLERTVARPFSRTLEKDFEREAEGWHGVGGRAHHR